MKLNLNDLIYYFLTCNNKKRKTHMEYEFKNYKLIEVNPIMNINKFSSGASGFCKILDIACINQDREKPFQPFAIFEDDVKKNRDFPSDIEIPEDTDLLYIGLSECGMNRTDWCKTVCFKNIDENIIRIYNMLSTHAMIIYSIRGLLLFQKCVFEDFIKSTQWDKSLARMQPFYNVYALKNPLVYQYSKLGGEEKSTKIDYLNKKDSIIPKEWIINDTDSIRTNYYIQPREFIVSQVSETIKNYSYSDNLFRNLKPIKDSDINTKKNNVFLYWTGPQYKLIKLFIYLIYLHSERGKNYSVHLITDKNIQKYIKNIPDIFYSLKPAHQADYIRVNVICDYGGIWLDSDTLVMDNLQSLFYYINKKNRFFVKSRTIKGNTYKILCNGVFGSNKQTPLMKEIKKQVNNIVQNLNTHQLNWNKIGSDIFNSIDKKLYKDYIILDGVQSIFPIVWYDCVNEFLIKPYDNYKNIVRKNQPVIILVNSIYKKLEDLTEEEIMTGNMPINYFINKALKI